MKQNDQLESSSVQLLSRCCILLLSLAAKQAHPSST